MNPFDQKFIENPLFLKWIFKSGQGIERHWKQYLLLHPEERTQILELKDRLSELKFSNDQLQVSEKDELAQRICSAMDRDTRQVKRRQMVQSFMKYAAVAVIFAAIGGLLVYLNMEKESVYQAFARQTITVPASSQVPLLITSTGNNVNLKKSSSTVDYSKKGSVVLNNDSVLQTPEEDSNTMNQLVIPYGNQSRVVLSDNTVVWLNAGSRLIYPTKFKDKTREVMLFGEAFFEVTKNPKQPFVVKTFNLDIKVLGTKFNVSAYAEDQVIQTVLNEGSVAIRRNGANFFEDDVVIKPNQMASFDKSSYHTKIFNVSADSYSLWTKGLICFEDDDFSHVVKQVERFYNISVTFSDHRAEVMRISGKLDLKRSKKEVMEYLEKVSLTSFEKINENQYRIN
ncbi:MAG: FecR domain-containing protein [Prolixibacteraceae bacterium]